MKCPNCKLINPDSAQRCDCGYDFISGLMEKSYLEKTNNDDSEKESDEYEAAFLGITAFLLGLVTFVACWAYAIITWGWFLGLAFGWIPAGIIAYIVSMLTPFIILLLGVGVIIYFVNLDG